MNHALTLGATKMRLPWPALAMLFTMVSGCTQPRTERFTETAHFKIPKSIPPVPQRPLGVELPGLPNFGFVTTEVWRGGEPTAEGLQLLATMGAKTVIDLRQADESADVPKTIKYIQMPVSAWHADQVDVVAVRRAIAASLKPVFIHCREGRDRTGLAIAGYRLSTGMSADDACRELRNFHVNWWWDSLIEDRIRELAQADN